MPRYIVTEKGGSQVYTIIMYSERAFSLVVYYSPTYVYVYFPSRLGFYSPKLTLHRPTTPCPDGER